MSGRGRPRKSNDSYYLRKKADAQQNTNDDIVVLMDYGKRGLKHSWGLIDEEFHKDLKGTKANKMYREMTDNDPIVAMSLDIIDTTSKSVERKCEANESGHPQANECHEFIESCFEDMRSTESERMTEINTQLSFGWSWLEECYKIRCGPEYDDVKLNSNFSDRRIGWSDWECRAQESFYKWKLTDNADVIALIQQNPSDCKEYTIPFNKSLHFKYRGRKGNPEGNSPLRNCYVSYYKKNKFQFVEGVGAERSLDGLLKIQLPKRLFSTNRGTNDSTEWNYWLDFVKKVRADELQGILFPQEVDQNNNPTGYKAELMSSSGKNLAAVDPIIRRYETRMAMIFATMGVFLGIDGIGARALGETNLDIMVMKISGYLDTIDEVINRVAIPRLCKLNGFPTEAHPKRYHTQVNKMDVLKLAQAAATMLSSGAMDSSRELNNKCRESLDLPLKQDNEYYDVKSMVESTPYSVGNGSGENVSQETSTTDARTVVEQKSDNKPDMLDVDEAAEYLRVPRSSIMRAIRSGKLPGAKIGNSFRIARTDLETHLRGGI